eukprot:15052062-Alexandrium_andersonii.AAC.1
MASAEAAAPQYTQRSSSTAALSAARLNSRMTAKPWAFGRTAPWPRGRAWRTHASLALASGPMAARKPPPTIGAIQL